MLPLGLCVTQVDQQVFFETALPAPLDRDLIQLNRITV
jgi:hypothetical protein